MIGLFLRRVAPRVRKSDVGRNARFMELRLLQGAVDRLIVRAIYKSKETDFLADKRPLVFE